MKIELIAALVILAGGVRADSGPENLTAFRTGRQLDRILRTDRHAPPANCDQISVAVRDGYLARGENAMELAPSSRALRVSGPKQGGLYVRGGDRRIYQIVLCKFAVGDSTAQAAARLDKVGLSARDGVVIVVGPNGNDWRADLIVETPDDAPLTLDAADGPLSLERTSGRITARAGNGPLSLRRTAGVIHAEAQNGPLTLTEVAGMVHAIAHNGPLSIKLAGSGWEGAGLEARADNGPVGLNVPAGYRSSIELSVLGPGPFSCDAPLCAQAHFERDGALRRVRFGESSPVVRVSTRNGPVGIR